MDICYDLDSQRFGKLIVCGAPIRRKDRIYYRCICKSGKETVVRRDHLTNGATTSCGQCEEIINEGSHMRYVCKNGRSFLFDIADLELISQHCWYVSANGYASTRLKETRRVAELPRMLLDAPPGINVDHINGNTLDNRRVNLRLATQADNLRNLSLKSSNTSGYKGVSYVARRDKYRAYITLNKKAKHLGYFIEPVEAARAYDKAARFFFGEFSCLNFPLAGEQGCRRLAT